MSSAAAPVFSIRAIELFERPVVLRLPFRFGVVTRCLSDRGAEVFDPDFGLAKSLPRRALVSLCDDFFG